MLFKVKLELEAEGSSIFLCCVHGPKEGDGEKIWSWTCVVLNLDLFLPNISQSEQSDKWDA